MKSLLVCTVLVTLSAFPALSQTAAAPLDLSGFRDEIANKNKALADRVNAEKLQVKKNAAIIEDVKKIDADNKRLDAERKQLDAQNAEFERQRRAMMAILADSNGTTTDAPQAAPAPTPTRVEVANANITPTNSNGNSTPVIDPIVRTAPVSQAPQAPQVSQPTQVAAAYVPTTATIVATAGPTRVPENVAMGLLLSPIRPVYPQIAQNARIQGEVVLDAVISKTGVIERLDPVSGPELLRHAAMDAVQKARYQPYKVNGESVQVATTITVAFRMGS